MHVLQEISSVSLGVPAVGEMNLSLRFRESERNDTFGNTNHRSKALGSDGSKR